MQSAITFLHEAENQVNEAVALRGLEVINYKLDVCFLLENRKLKQPRNTGSLWQLPAWVTAHAYLNTIYLHAIKT